MKINRGMRNVGHNGVSRGNGDLSAEHDELLRLRKEVQRLRMEREILTPIFAVPN
jgi:hypothetical protein